MPRTVDHGTRRAELADAVWRIAADRGLAAASLREVAAEAGWSLGALRHYFASRDELLLFAFGVAAERGWARMRRAAASGGAAREALRRSLLEALPLDEERRTECRVWFAFLVAADGAPALAAERDRAYDAIVETLSADLGGGALGEQAARGLWAAVDGITLQALAQPERLPPDRQRALLDAALDRLVP